MAKILNRLSVILSGHKYAAQKIQEYFFYRTTYEIMNSHGLRQGIKDA
jgi:hypothetical protein